MKLKFDFINQSHREIFPVLLFLFISVSFHIFCEVWIEYFKILVNLKINNKIYLPYGEKSNINTSDKSTLDLFVYLIVSFNSFLLYFGIKEYLPETKNSKLSKNTTYY